MVPAPAFLRRRAGAARGPLRVSSQKSAHHFSSSRPWAPIPPKERRPTTAPPPRVPTRCAMTSGARVSPDAAREQYGHACSALDPEIGQSRRGSGTLSGECGQRWGDFETSRQPQSTSRLLPRVLGRLGRIQGGAEKLQARSANLGASSGHARVRFANEKDWTPEFGQTRPTSRRIRPIAWQPGQTRQNLVENGRPVYTSHSEIVPQVNGAQTVAVPEPAPRRRCWRESRLLTHDRGFYRRLSHAGNG